MSLQYFVDAPHAPEDWLTPVLVQHRDWWSPGVQAILADDGCVILRGSVRSYHHKQLAQETFLRSAHARGVRNELRVIPAQSSSEN